MIAKGWSHQVLGQMEESEFLFWLDQQNEMERLKEEALEE